jgi:hypothetical protein
MHLVRHAGLDPASRRALDVLARFGELRLPSVARLELIPVKTEAGMRAFMKTVVYGQTLISHQSLFNIHWPMITDHCL